MLKITAYVQNARVLRYEIFVQMCEWNSKVRKIIFRTKNNKNTKSTPKYSKVLQKVGTRVQVLKYRYSGVQSTPKYSTTPYFFPKFTPSTLLLHIFFEVLFYSILFFEIYSKYSCPLYFFSKFTPSTLVLHTFFRNLQQVLKYSITVLAAPSNFCVSIK